MSADSIRRNFAVWLGCLLVLAVTAYGQTPGTGAISGVVVDPANRAVGHAEVLTVDEATHMSRSVVTTAEGVFRVPLLPPGIYTVTVKATGGARSEEHTSELQSLRHLVCRLL